MDERTIHDLYREIAESSIDAIVCCRGGRIIFWNRAAERTFGYRKEEILGKDVEVLIPERLKEAHRRAIKRMLETGECRLSGKVVEVEAMRKDGTIFPVSLSLCERLEKGNIISIAIIRDITESKKKEGILRAINDCLLGLGTDYKENVSRVTEVVGTILNGFCSLYKRLDKGLLISVGKWHVPPDYRPWGKPEGDICYEVVKNRIEPVVVRDLQHTPYAETGPHIKAYGLKTYIGCPVRLKGETVGVLCVFFTEDRDFSADEVRVLETLAGVLGMEEERQEVVRTLEDKLEELERMNRLMVGRELRMKELKKEIKGLKERLKELEEREDGGS